jgi:hypothetical protein
MSQGCTELENVSPISVFLTLPNGTWPSRFYSTDIKIIVLF